MPPDSEFELIARYFSWPTPTGILGVGDDCALLPVSHGFQMAVSSDMLVQGQHFFTDVDPADLGYKALAVNLSDLAAMGARPLACTLALSLPNIDHDWLQGFSTGFHELSRQAQCPLVGGDTTRNPAGVVISVTVMGEVRRNQALRRDAARVGDDIWVTGSLGAAELALRLLQGRLPADTARLAAVRQTLERPVPRLRFGQRLAGMAHAALDISDGLLQDLGHILRASHCGADLVYEQIPAASALGGLDEAVRQDLILAGGDCYELCFTASPKRRDQIQATARSLSVPVARVGAVVRGDELRVFNTQGSLLSTTRGGYDHFLDAPGNP